MSRRKGCLFSIDQKVHVLVKEDMLEEGSWDERSLKRTLPAVVLVFFFALMAFWCLKAMAEKLEPQVTTQDTENIRNNLKDLLPEEMEDFKAYYRHALIEAWIFSFTLPASGRG